MSHSYPVRFHGRAAEFFGIWIINILFTVLTLGVYSAWAKVRTKQYFYGNTELDDARFSYLATPIQILIGRLIAVALMLVWFWLSSFEPYAALGVMLVFFLLFPVLMVRNLRFDMRMTQYRNVRFNFNPAYGAAYVVYLLRPVAAYIAALLAFFVVMLASEFSGLVAGLLGVFALCVGGPYLYAWVTKGMAEYVANNLCYGTRPFTAQLSTSAYVLIAVKTLLFSLLVLLVCVVLISALFWMTGLAEDSVTVLQSFAQTEEESVGSGLASGLATGIFILYALLIAAGFVIHAYYAALVRNYVFAQVHVGDAARLASSLRPLPFAWLELSNLLAIVCTVGLAQPWAKVRRARFISACTGVQGDLEKLLVRDSEDEHQSAIADEVTQAFDLEIGVLG